MTTRLAGAPAPLTLLVVGALLIASPDLLDPASLAVHAVDQSGQLTTIEPRPGPVLTAPSEADALSGSDVQFMQGAGCFNCFPAPSVEHTLMIPPFTSITQHA